MAQFAKQKGVKRLFLSWDGGGYWGAYAADVGSAAKSLGIQIAGAAAFDPDARNYDQFARRIASPAPTGRAVGTPGGRRPHCYAISVPASVAV